jgi:hypothetical protein
MYPYVVLLAQLALGVIWVAAALAKLTTRQFERHAIARFNLLPSALASVVGIVLPWTELSLGGLLLSGQWTRAAAGASVVVLSVFTFAIVVSLVRGDHVECSCFAVLVSGESKRISFLVRSPQRRARRSRCNRGLACVAPPGSDRWWGGPAVRVTNLFVQDFMPMYLIALAAVLLILLTGAVRQAAHCDIPCHGGPRTRKRPE